MANMRPIKLIDETPTIVDGEPQPNEATILRSWAEIKETRGNQSVQNGQTGLTKFFEFRFRYRSTIELNGNVKLVCDGKRYMIHSIEKEDQRPFFWVVVGEAKTI